MSLVGLAVAERRSYLDTVAENATRLARVAVTFLSTGYGEFQLPKAVDFGVTFIEEPTVTCGWVLEPGQSLVAGKMPNCSAGVWRWQTETRHSPSAPKSYWTGAYLYLVVDSNSQPYNLRHNFVFEGTAIKLLDTLLTEP